MGQVKIEMRHGVRAELTGGRLGPDQLRELRGRVEIVSERVEPGCPGSSTAVQVLTFAGADREAFERVADELIKLDYVLDAKTSERYEGGAL